MKIKKKFQKTDLVILAGGYGSRIKKYLKDKPKPLLKFQNKPFLDLILNHYSKFPFEKIFILAGYKGKEIFNRYNDKYKNFIKIKVIIEKKPLGTGGSVKAISSQLENNTLIVNGDSFLANGIKSLIPISIFCWIPHDFVNTNLSFCIN